MTPATAEQIAALPKCIECHKPMRPSNTKVAEWPGTRYRCNAVLCSNCNARANSDARRTISDEEQRHRDLRTMVNYRSYIASRRRRGIPAEGLRVDA